jgi:hypothetical protein
LAGGMGLRRRAAGQADRMRRAALTGLRGRACAGGPGSASDGPQHPRQAGCGQQAGGQRAAGRRAAGRRAAGALGSRLAPPTHPTHTHLSSSALIQGQQQQSATSVRRVTQAGTSGSSSLKQGEGRNSEQASSASDSSAGRRRRGRWVARRRQRGRRGCLPGVHARSLQEHSRRRSRRAPGPRS